MPRERVWSREIDEGFARSLVAEAFEAGSIVIVDKPMEEGIAIGLIDEGSVSDAPLRLSANSFCNAPVEPLYEAIGLWSVRPGQPVINFALCADEIERMLTGWPIVRLVLHIDGKAIGELAAIVGQDGVHRMREVVQEALEEAGRGVGIASGMDLDIDVASGAIDRHEGIGLAPLQSRQVLEVDVDEANSRLLEGAALGLVRFGFPADAVTLQATVDGTARQRRPDTALHHLDDVIQGKLQRRPQLANQRLFLRGEISCQFLWPMRTILDCRPAAPASDRCLAHTKLGHQRQHGLLAALDIGACLRGGGRIGV